VTTSYDIFNVVVFPKLLSEC